MRGCGKEMRMLHRRRRDVPEFLRRPTQRPQFRRRPTQRPGDIDRIASLRSRPQQRPPALHRPYHHDVRRSLRTGATRRLRQVPPGERNLPSFRQRQQSVIEAGCPTPRAGSGTRQLTRHRQRHKCRHRPRPHRRNIAQSARQALVPHRLRRMPATAKMHLFKRKVRRDDNLFAAPHRQHRSIVANPHTQRARRTAAHRTRAARARTDSGCRCSRSPIRTAYPHKQQEAGNSIVPSPASRVLELLCCLNLSSRSNRSRLVTFAQAATKSLTNFSFASSLA